MLLEYIDGLLRVRIRLGGALIGRGVAVAGSFLLTLVVARMFGSESAGAFFAVTTLLTLFATFGRFGVDNLSLKMLGGGDNLGGRLLALLRFSAVISLSLAALLVLFLWLSGFGYAGASWGVLALTVTSVVPLALSVIAGTWLRGLGSIGFGVVAESGSVPLLALTLMLVFNGGGLESALLLYALAAWLTALWSIPFAVAKLGGLRRLMPLPGIGKLMPQLGYMMAMSLLVFGIVWAPVFALTFFGSLATVSLYTIAFRLAGFLQLVPVMQVSYLAPSFARLYQATDLAGLSALGRSSSRNGTLLVLFPALVLLLLAEPLLQLLYGAEYVPAAAALRVLTVMFVLKGALGQVSQLMLLCDLERAATVLSGSVMVLWFACGPLAATLGAAPIALVSAILSLGNAGVGAYLLHQRGIRSFL